MSGGDYGGRRKFNRVKVHSNPISQGWNTQSHHPPSTCNHIKVIQYTFHVQRNTFKQYRRNRRIIRGPNTWRCFTIYIENLSCGWNKPSCANWKIHWVMTTGEKTNWSKCRRGCSSGSVTTAIYSSCHHLLPRLENWPSSSSTTDRYRQSTELYKSSPIN